MLLFAVFMLKFVYFGLAISSIHGGCIFSVMWPSLLLAAVGEYFTVAYSALLSKYRTFAVLSQGDHNSAVEGFSSVGSQS